MIVYCCPDLMFAGRIGAAARDMGLPARPARDAAMLRRRLDRVDDGKGNDPVRGVIVDLGLGPAAFALIRQSKAHDPQIMVVAYGSHVATDLMRQARDAGADVVLPNSQFAANLSSILSWLAGRTADG